MSVIIRLQNLPWAANAADIRAYFRGLSIPEGGVHIVGGEQGDAFIAFSTDEDARQAMQRDGGKLKEVMIKLLLSSRTEMMKVIEQARQQALNLQQLINTPVTSAAQPVAQQGETNEGDKEKEDDDKSSSGERDNKRDRRRSRSRSRSRSRGRDRSRDRSRERDRSRDRRRDRRRRDRSRSRDRYRSRRDRSRERRDRSRDREYFSKSRNNRDGRGSFEGKRDMNEMGDYQRGPKPANSNPPNKVLLPTPGVPNSGPGMVVQMNQVGKSEPYIQMNQNKVGGEKKSDPKSANSSNLQQQSSLQQQLQQPQQLQQQVPQQFAFNPGMQGATEIQKHQALQAPPSFIPPPELQMMAGFPHAGVMFPSIPVRGPLPSAREAWYSSVPQTALPLAVQRMPVMQPPEMMPMPTFPQPQPTASLMSPFNPNPNANSTNSPQENLWKIPANTNQLINPDSMCIEIHGLPLNVTQLDILQFFEGFPIEQGGIKIINDTQGKRTGIAYVKFAHPHCAQTSLNLDGKILNGNSVDILPLKDSLFETAVNDFKPEQPTDRQRDSPSPQRNINNGLSLENSWQRNANIQSPEANVNILASELKDKKVQLNSSNAVMIQGLPVKSNDRDIFDFFSESGIAPIHIHMFLDSTGNQTGEAFCQFENIDQALRAALKNNCNVGRSTVTIRVVSKDEYSTLSPAVTEGIPENVKRPEESKKEETAEISKVPSFPEREVQAQNPPKRRERVSRFDKVDDDFVQRINQMKPDTMAPGPTNSGIDVSKDGRDPRKERGINIMSERNNDHSSTDSEQDPRERKSDPRSNKAAETRSPVKDTEAPRPLMEIEPRPLMELDVAPVNPPVERENFNPGFRGMGPNSRGIEPRPLRGSGHDPRGDRIINARTEIGNDSRGGAPGLNRSFDPRGMDPRTSRSLESRGDPRMDRSDRDMDVNEIELNSGIPINPRSNRPMDPRGPRPMNSNEHMDPRGNRLLDPRAPRPMDPRVEKDRSREMGDDIQEGRMEPSWQRNMDPRAVRNMESRHERFNEPFTHPNDPRRDNRSMDPNADNFPEREGGFGRHLNFPGRPLLGEGWRHREEFSLNPPMGIDMGRGGMIRGRGRGRGNEFYMRGGRGGRGGIRPPFPHGPGVPQDSSRPFMKDDVLQNFGAPGKVVAIENLHFKASVEDIIDFFHDFKIEYEDVIRRFDDLGRPTGDARVAFHTKEEAQKAVNILNFANMMGRQIKLRLLC